MSDVDPLDRIVVSDTAREKRGRYLDEAAVVEALRSGEGYVCRKSSPNHEGLYEDNRFVFRGEFDGVALDLVFVVEADHVVVVTQMSQHADSLRGRFYERVGSTAADAVRAVRE
jgi:hypothetical protein